MSSEEPEQAEQPEQPDWGETPPSVPAEDVDRRFKSGEDLFESWEAETPRSPGLRSAGLEVRRVNVAFPSWMIDSLDKEAKRMGVSRQAVIKVWIAERLDAA